MIKAILFDKDGTLIEFEKTWHSIMSIIFNKLETELKLTMEQINQLKNISGYKANGFTLESQIQYLPTSQIINNWVSALSQNKAHQQGLTRLLRKVFEEATIDEQVVVELLPFTKECLTYFAERNYCLGIATADTEPSMVHGLKKAGIFDYFHFLGCDNGYFKGKPDPHMAKEFCRKINILEEELLIVGDSVNDYQFAKNVGASFVGIMNEYGAFNEKDGTISGYRLVNHLKEMIVEMSL